MFFLNMVNAKSDNMDNKNGTHAFCHIVGENNNIVVVQTVHIHVVKKGGIIEKWTQTWGEFLLFNSNTFAKRECNSNSISILF